MKRWTKGVLLGLAIGVLGAGFVQTELGGDFEQSVGLDWLFQVRGPSPSPRDVVVVAVDSRTGPKLGHPELLREWPRSTHGKLVERLTKAGASVIAFDMDFTRPRDDVHDRQFADAVAASGRVSLIQTLNGKRQPIVGRDGKPSGFVWVEQLKSPIDPLRNAAAGLAPFPLPKVQVAVYRYWAFKDSAGDVPTMPALALQLHVDRTAPGWRSVFQAAGIDVPPHGDGAAGLETMMTTLRADFLANPALADRVRDAAAKAAVTPKARSAALALAGLYGGSANPLLNFYGPPGTIRTVPYHAFLTHDPAVPPEMLDVRNKVVFVGFSDLFDPGQPDRFYTVFTGKDGVDLSGVEIMATAFANLLSHSPIRQAGFATGFVLTLAVGLLLGAIVYTLPALYGLPLAIALAAAYAVGAQWLFNTRDLWLPLATPMLAQFPLAVVAGLLGQYLLERRERQIYSHAVSYFLPEDVLKDLTKAGTDVNALDRVVYGTCLASDMSGFTTLAEAMAPTELADFLNAYYEAIAAQLKTNGVDMTEFHADMIMCAWLSPDSAPVANPRSIQAALDVIEAVDAFGQSRGRPLTPRAGMDFGQFYLGHAGGGGHYAFSILGDTANTAARLESLNKSLGTRLLATEPVLHEAEGLLYRPLGRFQLVGKTDPTSVYEILGRQDRATAELRARCERFAEGLAAFGGQRWDEATRTLEAYLNETPQDAAAELYLDLSRRYRDRAPESGDPSVIVMDVK